MSIRPCPVRSYTDSCPHWRPVLPEGGLWRWAAGPIKRPSRAMGGAAAGQEACFVLVGTCNGPLRVAAEKGLAAFAAKEGVQAFPLRTLAYRLVNHAPPVLSQHGRRTVPCVTPERVARKSRKEPEEEGPQLEVDRPLANKRVKVESGMLGGLPGQ